MWYQESICPLRFKNYRPGLISDRAPEQNREKLTRPLQKTECSLVLATFGDNLLQVPELEIGLYLDLDADNCWVQFELGAPTCKHSERGGGDQDSAHTGPN